MAFSDICALGRPRLPCDCLRCIARKRHLRTVSAHGRYHQAYMDPASAAAISYRKQNSTNKLLLILTTMLSKFNNALQMYTEHKIQYKNIKTYFAILWFRLISNVNKHAPCHVLAPARNAT